MIEKSCSSKFGTYYKLGMRDEVELVADSVGIIVQKLRKGAKHSSRDLTPSKHCLQNCASTDTSFSQGPTAFSTELQFHPL